MSILPRIIVLCGYSRSGKDTAGGYFITNIDRRNIPLVVITDCRYGGFRPHADGITGAQ